MKECTREMVILQYIHCFLGGPSQIELGYRTTDFKISNSNRIVTEDKMIVKAPVCVVVNAAIMT